MNGSAIVYTTQFVTRLMREHGAARHHVMRPPVLLMASRVYSSTLSSTQAITVVQNFQQRAVGSIERRFSLLKRRSSRQKSPANAAFSNHSIKIPPTCSSSSSCFFDLSVVKL